MSQVHYFLSEMNEYITYFCDNLHCAMIKTSISVDLPQRFSRNWKVILGTGAITVMVNLGVFYLHPNNVTWFNSPDFTWGNLLHFIIIDQFLIEIPSVVSASFCLGYYTRLFEISNFKNSARGIMLLYLKYMPLLFVLYFFTATISLNIRYLYHKYIVAIAPKSYFESYFFIDWKLYLGYLLPLFLIWFLLLTVHLMRVINTITNTTEIETKKETLLVKDGFGEKSVQISDIVVISKVGRKYYVNDKRNNAYQISDTLDNLKENLGDKFFRINRSTLINLEFLESFAFWENQKYIVKLTTGAEFQSSRIRIKLLKEKI